MKIDFQFILTALPQIISHIPVTLNLTVVVLFISFVIGVLFALINTKKVKILYPLVRVYMSLIRGTPMILQIYVIYNLSPYLLAELLKKLGSNYNIYNLNPIWYAYVALSLTATVGIAEALRAGLEGIDKGQREAALSVGLSEKDAFFKVVFPQAFTTAMPVLTNCVVDIIKSTSLAFMMSVLEITGQAKVIAGSLFKYFEAYICVFIIYIVLISLIEKLLHILEKKVSVYRVGTHRSV
jgi:His/Glu/Gln/Arg/opine family amino acid ABC transporter permease subunit